MILPRFLFRRGTTSEWAAKNPVLLPGEAGYNTTTGDLRVGDGVNTWSALPSQLAAGKVTKGADVVNVRDYGAVGDGVADDTAAIQAAVTANPGRTILVPRGTYLVDPLANPAQQSPYRAGIRLTAPGTTLRLEGGATLTCKPNNADRYTMVEVTAAYCTVTGGAIVGDLTGHTTSTGEWGYCVQITPGADYATVADIALADAWGDCVMIGDSGSFTSGVLVKGVTLRNVSMDRARRNNLSVVAARDLLVTGCRFTRAGTVSGTFPKCGVDVEPNPGGLQDVIGAVFTGCLFEGNAAHGFATHAQGRTAEVTVQGCTSRGNTVHGFALTSTARVDFRDCLATGNGSAGFTPDSYTGTGSAFVNCRAVGNTSVGFTVGTGLEAVGCVAEGNTAGGILVTGSGRATSCTGRGNLGGYYADLSVEGGAGAVLTACNADAGPGATKSARGFRLFAGSTGTVLTGCTAVGAFTAAAFTDAATGTTANPVPGKAVGFTGATTGTTAPAAGGAGALPATPAGYYTVNVNGTDRKVAYY